jgi:ABC-type lipoprotein release transport system permease subunit
MMSIKDGMFQRMIQTMVGTYTGYAQVQHPDYWEEKNLDNSIVYSDSLVEQVYEHDAIVGHIPRIEGFALSATDSMTQGAMVMGTDPELEKKLTQMDQQVVEGEYFSSDDQAVLIGSGLASYLKVGVGDTLVLIGQGYHAMTAAGKYPIKGILKFGSPEMSRRLVVLPLQEADRLFSMEGRITSLVLLFDDFENAPAIARAVDERLDQRFATLDWTQLLQDVMDMIENEDAESAIFMIILYMVVSFGIFGTVLMMLAERKHEFGVLVGIGMKRSKLALMVWAETVLLSLIGAFVGLLGAFPVCYYFYVQPIYLGSEVEELYADFGMEPYLQASIEPAIFLEQALIVGLVASVIAIYPLVKLLRLNAINEMRA